MGIPKYFRHITKNNPDLIIEDFENVTVINNLYFDMNCLIHPCVRNIMTKFPELVKKHNIVQITNKYNNIKYISDFEQEIYKNIDTYLDKLIGFINPDNLIYLAIDGVAPRAKMEQQRMRRYRSIKVNKMREEILAKHNVDEVNFDTNCITPGTIFMLKLSNHLKEYIDKKYDELKVSIYLDDSNNIGEGEHKILQHMKEFSKDKINCIYGLDADLIMLSLVSGCKTYLLRESVHFGKVDMDKLLLFDVNSFSDCLFKTIEEKLYFDNETKDISNSDNQSEMEIEKDRVINDYICLCFLIGNDFLPPIVALDINFGSINSLLEIYCNIFKIRQKYLVLEDYTINFIFIRQILTYLYSNEYAYLEKYQNKISYRKPFLRCKSPIERELEKLKYYPVYNKNNFLKFGKYNWTDLYYKYYFNIENIEKNTDFINYICNHYIEGLQWNIKYYLDKCISYSWYYKFRAAPLLQHLSKFLINRVYPVKFNNIVFSPLEQLSIVLPLKSNHLWCEDYRKKVKNSLELQMLYPINFKLDTLNKFFLHECEPILADFDSTLIKEIFKKLKLTQLEQQLNCKGQMYIKGESIINLEIV